MAFGRTTGIPDKIGALVQAKGNRHRITQYLTLSDVDVMGITHEMVAGIEPIDVESAMCFYCGGAIEIECSAHGNIDKIFHTACPRGLPQAEKHRWQIRLMRWWLKHVSDGPSARLLGEILFGWPVDSW